MSSRMNTGAPLAPANQSTAEPPLLELRGFWVGFGANDPLWAVRGTDLDLRSGETLGIVGESGCGKSVMSQSIMRLLEHDSAVSYRGELHYLGQNLLELPLSDMRGVRGGEIAMVFQDPLSSFDPLCKIGSQVTEAIMAHNDCGKAKARQLALESMEAVGIPNAAARMGSRPDSFSGGQLQRLMLAMALALKPRVLIADEPTTALDTTTQAEILALFNRIIRETGMAMIFVSHDLNVVAKICERACVMYRGAFVEQAPIEELFEHPAHPYTQGLIGAIPPIEGPIPERLSAIEGIVPPLSENICGCAFAHRCAHASERCRKEAPPRFKVTAGADASQPGGTHTASCWLLEGGAR